MLTDLVVDIYDNQIVHHNSCVNLFILHNSFDNQLNEISKNAVFQRLDIFSFTENFLPSLHLKI